jgi:hypothetical protein
MTALLVRSLLFLALHVVILAMLLVIIASNWTRRFTESERSYVRMIR